APAVAKVDEFAGEAARPRSRSRTGRRPDGRSAVQLPGTSELRRRERLPTGAPPIRARSEAADLALMLGQDLACVVKSRARRDTRRLRRQIARRCSPRISPVSPDLAPDATTAA